MLRCLVFLFALCLLTGGASTLPTACHDSERLALLQLKKSLLIREFASAEPSAYPKVQQWKSDGKGNGDCCAWDGVECNNRTGHVIGLDLSSSFLYGSINFTNSLFHLLHLRRLNLSENNFNGSKIPFAIANLSRLSHLDLSKSAFSGLLPSSIGELTKLEHMDLSDNHFSGQIPSSLANLTKLTYLSLSKNSFSPGDLSWLGKQTKLKTLRLKYASLYGEIPSSLGNLTQLTTLFLSDNQFTGQFPYCLENLKQLTILGLAGNQITGSIPCWLGNLTRLTGVDLGSNNLQGQIPRSIFNLVNLGTLFLNANELNGTLKFETFLNLSNLINLQLSYQCYQCNLSLDTNITINATVPKFRDLTLGSCNLTEFPDFLREQDELEILQLTPNKIHGQIPKWVWEKSKESLVYLDLSENFLTGFDQPIFPLTNLQILHLESNKLQGSLPIPPSSIVIYSVSNNSLTGEFSPLLCNLSSLVFLELSNNNFSGMLPQCLSNLSESLLVLSLRNNNFVGSIPQLCKKGSELMMIDFNQNQFQGQLPRSLVNCGMIETLNVGNNQLNDTFPFWMGKLPMLRILILQRNQFHGIIEEQRESFEFPKLQIIDLSFNRFTGKLLSWFFDHLIAMKAFDAANSSYLQANTDVNTQHSTWYNDFNYSMTITSKGTERYYKKIPEFLVAIDFSSNSFEGCIPDNIGNLKALWLLNFSNNFLSCHIPPSLGNLSNLESLDLSHNNLSGEIPTELLQLSFLEFLNVSQNYLKGQIPQGKQFATFENNSFGSNPGLCGKPLSKTCTHLQVSPPPLSSEEDEGQEPLVQFDWKIILTGFGSGLVIGVSIGSLYTPNRNNRFVKYLRRMQQKRSETWRRWRN